MRSAFLLALLLLMVGCRKDPDLNGFVPGEVLFSLVDAASFDDTYQLVQDLDLDISFVGEFTYLTDTSLLSLDSIRTVLRTKSYLGQHGGTFGIDHWDSGTYISATFYDFDASDNLDWHNTIVQLGLVETPSVTDGFFKWGILLVPIGQERAWVEELPKHDIVRNAQLNHYID